MSTLSDVVQFAGGTAAQFASLTTPIPLGTLTIESDTGIIKAGDGSSLYSALPILTSARNISNLSKTYIEGLTASTTASSSATSANQAATQAALAATQAASHAQSAASNAAAAAADSANLTGSISQLTAQVSGLSAGGVGGATATNQQTVITNLESLLLTIQGAPGVKLAPGTNQIGSVSISNPSTIGDGVIVGGAETVVVINAGGASNASYAPSDTITVFGGTGTTSAILEVTATQVVSASIVAGGTGGTNGTEVVTGTTGVGTKFQASVTITGGIITAIDAISLSGSYTTNPTVLTSEPVTGAGLTGAALSVVMGVASVVITNHGVYSIPPTNPIIQGTTTGVGTGATFNLSFAPISQVLFNGTAPINGWKINNANPTEDLWVADNGATAAVSTGYRIFANGGQYATEPGEKPIGTLSIIGNTIGHSFIARRW